MISPKARCIEPLPFGGVDIPPSLLENIVSHLACYLGRTARGWVRCVSKEFLGCMRARVKTGGVRINSINAPPFKNLTTLLVEVGRSDGLVPPIRDWPAVFPAARGMVLTAKCHVVDFAVWEELARYPLDVIKFRGDVPAFDFFLRAIPVERWMKLESVELQVRSSPGGARPWEYTALPWTDAALLSVIEFLGSRPLREVILVGPAEVDLLRRLRECPPAHLQASDTVIYDLIQCWPDAFQALKQVSVHGGQCAPIWNWSLALSNPRAAVAYAWKMKSPPRYIPYNDRDRYALKALDPMFPLTLRIAGLVGVLEYVYAHSFERRLEPWFEETGSVETTAVACLEHPGVFAESLVGVVDRTGDPHQGICMLWHVIRLCNRSNPECREYLSRVTETIEWVARSVFSRIDTVNVFAGGLHTTEDYERSLTRCPSLWRIYYSTTKFEVKVDHAPAGTLSVFTSRRPDPPPAGTLNAVGHLHAYTTWTEVLLSGEGVGSGPRDSSFRLLYNPDDAALAKQTLLDRRASFARMREAINAIQQRFADDPFVQLFLDICEERIRTATANSTDTLREVLMGTGEIVLR